MIPFATIGGTRTHYVWRGERGDGLVFIHGVGGSSSDWRLQAEAFGSEWRTLAADHWGHGRSGTPADVAACEVEQVARDVVVLADSLGRSRFHLVGHSLGGAVAQEVALGNPERVITLTLADTTDWFGDHDASGRPLLVRELTEEEREARERLPREALAQTWDALLGWRGTRERAAQILVPALVVHGAMDAPKIIEGSGRLAASIPRATLSVIDGAGHDPHIEQPEAFNHALRMLLTSA